MSTHLCSRRSPTRRPWRKGGSMAASSGWRLWTQTAPLSSARSAAMRSSPQTCRSRWTKTVRTEGPGVSVRPLARLVSSAVTWASQCSRSVSGSAGRPGPCLVLWLLFDSAPWSDSFSGSLGSWELFLLSYPNRVKASFDTNLLALIYVQLSVLSLWLGVVSVLRVMRTFYSSLPLVMLGIQSRASCMLGKCPPTGLHTRLALLPHLKC